MISTFSSVVNKVGYFHHSISIMRSLSSFPQLFRDLIADAQDRQNAYSTRDYRDLISAIAFLVIAAIA
ncbi:MAG: hypothetical protein F6K41_45075 [Symploca sp. SIO3E6]|nr:hypothetical protein [Caldora sp. SIO3E6]